MKLLLFFLISMIYGAVVALLLHHYNVPAISLDAAAWFVVTVLPANYITHYILFKLLK